MDKNEILEKSRQDNKGKDPYEEEVDNKSNLACIIVIAALCCAFALFEIIIGAQGYYAFGSLTFAACAAQHFYKAKKLKQKKYTVLALCYLIAAICFTASYLFVMINAYCLS